MSEIVTRPRVETRPKTARPRMHRVVLLNDDYTPRAFVVMVLKAVFRMSRSEAEAVMLTAHMRGVCIVAVFTREIAETKADAATEMGKRAGYPLTFATQPET